MYGFVDAIINLTLLSQSDHLVWFGLVWFGLVWSGVEWLSLKRFPCNNEHYNERVCIGALYKNYNKCSCMLVGG